MYYKLLSLGTSFGGYSSSNSFITMLSTACPVETDTVASSIFLVIIALLLLSLTTGSTIYVIIGVILIAVPIIIIAISLIFFGYY